MEEVVDEVELADGGRIEVTARYPRFELRLSLRGRIERMRLPYPDKGVAGAELVVSPSERYLVVFLYSGQSEQGYEAFELSPHLRHVGGLPYIAGEGAAFAFSADETQLAMVYPLSCTGIGDDDLAGAKRDQEGRVLVELGGIRIHDLVSGARRACVLRARLAADHEPTEEAVDARDFDPRFAGGAHLRLALPWAGEVRVPLPLPDEVVVDVPGHPTRA